MRDVLVMQVLDRFSDLADYSGCCRFGKYFILLELSVEGALFHVLQDDVEVSGIVEKSVHS